MVQEFPTVSLDFTTPLIHFVIKIGLESILVLYAELGRFDTQSANSHHL